MWTMNQRLKMTSLQYFERARYDQLISYSEFFFHKSSIALEPMGYYYLVSNNVNRLSYFPWQEYNYGEEFVLLITFAKNASDKNTKDAMDSFAQLTSSLPSLIVQSTQGS